MKLIFFRHGHTTPKKKWHSDLDDFKRLLTRKGKSDVKKVSKRLKHCLQEADVLFTSPLLRAVQTAQEIYPYLHNSQFEILPSLDKLLGPESFLKDIKKLKEGTYIFVGHEPHFGKVFQALMQFPPSKGIDLPKGGCLILEGKTMSELNITLLMRPNLKVK